MHAVCYTDLTTLGLNLNSSECLYSTFASPWADAPAQRDPEFSLPQCYYMQPPALKTGHFSKFQLETLFYIFYNMPRDTLQVCAPTRARAARRPRPRAPPRGPSRPQAAPDRHTPAPAPAPSPRPPRAPRRQAYAATELYNRDWRYHKDLKLWFTKASRQGGAADSQKGQYIYFDISEWKKKTFRGGGDGGGAGGAPGAEPGMEGDAPGIEDALS